MEQLDKLVPEADNNTVNKVTQMLKDFDERMTFNNLGLSQRYIEGEVRLIMHIRLAGDDYVAVFERSTDTAWQPETANLSYSVNDVVRNLEVGPLERDERDEQSVVLIGNVQFMDRPKKLIPTLVRVGDVNGIYGTLPHALYSSMSLGFVFRGQLPEREGGLLGRRVTRDENKLIGEVVKSTSEIVDNVAHPKSDFNGRLFKIHHAINQLSRLRVFLDVDSIGFGFGIDESVANDFQVTDVLVGPFNFYADKRESFVSRRH